MKSLPLLKRVAFFSGPVFFLLCYNWPGLFPDPLAQKVVAVAIWMVVWWLTEIISISTTALLPIVLFPLLNILPLRDVCANYGSPIVFLFFGGFVMALALEKVNLHRRIALNIIKLTGTSPDRVILGFMISTALLSMWISNTASTVVMLPIALSVIRLIANDEDGMTLQDRNFALAIMLGIAFSANIGGVATLIGTPPNSVLAGFLENEYQIEISFFKWMQMGLPFSILMLFVCYFVIVKWMVRSKSPHLSNASELIKQEIIKLGPTRKDEKFVMAVFGMAILLWVFKNPLNHLTENFNLSDAGISMLAAFSLFIIPSDNSRDNFILVWNDMVKLPWGILILFGGGLALASGLASAGIMDLIGSAVSSGTHINLLLVSAFLILIMLFMTELMSNVALVAVFIPVVAGIALGLDSSILHICIPVTMAASCAFMLPMATPPNAIVFASGHVKVYQMAKVGIVLNLLSVLLLIVFTKFVIPLIF
ncbi:MAG: DASS family sodium-coupled anion symporter [Bacteroidia bacterium]|nr:DASS family sodium-coupled anion symporter [Bacteroidia bacterium]NNK90444.1 DASS family sodium-coupled anion symporter [Saprospiraceae bacterium]